MEVQIPAQANRVARMCLPFIFLAAELIFILISLSTFSQVDPKVVASRTLVGQALIGVSAVPLAAKFSRTRLEENCWILVSALTVIVLVLLLGRVW